MKVTQKQLFETVPKNSCPQKASADQLHIANSRYFPEWPLQLCQQPINPCLKTFT